VRRGSQCYREGPAHHRGPRLYGFQWPELAFAAVSGRFGGPQRLLSWPWGKPGGLFVARIVGRRPSVWPFSWSESRFVGSLWVAQAFVLA
jgi:hypothetical protein